MKVISGAQNGVDQAGLEAAEIVGFERGGTIPKGAKTLDGPRIDLVRRHNLMVSDSPNYAVRTANNVADAQATVSIAVDHYSRGEICTRKAVKKYARPFLVVTAKVEAGVLRVLCPPETVAKWIVENAPDTVNIAGNSEVTAPGIQAVARDFLVQVFKLVQEIQQCRQNKNQTSPLKRPA